MKPARPVFIEKGKAAAGTGGLVEKNSSGSCDNNKEKQGINHNVKKHAVQKLVWLREEDRRRSECELLKALKHQRIYIDQSAVHYVAHPRNTARADARNSVFKLSQRYTKLPDAEEVRRIRQLFTHVKEDEDSGDDDAVSPSFRKRPGGAGDTKSRDKKGGGGERGDGTGGTVAKKGAKGAEKGEAEPEENNSGSGDRGSGKRWVEEKTEKREEAAAPGITCRTAEESSGSSIASGGSHTAVSGAGEEVSRDELGHWLQTHPPTPDDIFEVFAEFGREIEPAAAEGAVSVEALGDDGIADSFTERAAEQLLGGWGSNRQRHQPLLEVAGSSNSSSGTANAPAAAVVATTRRAREMQKQRQEQEKQGVYEDTEEETGDEDEDGEVKQSLRGSHPASRTPAATNEQRSQLNQAEAEALNVLQKAFITNSLYTWFEDVRKAYAYGSKLIRVNALGYKFIRVVRVTPVLLTVEPIHATASGSQRRIPIVSITGVHLGKRSREFTAINERIETNRESESNNPPATSCAVVGLPNNRTLSLIFLDEFYRNSFVFFLRVLMERVATAEKQLRG